MSQRKAAAAAAVCVLQAIALAGLAATSTFAAQPGHRGLRYGVEPIRFEDQAFE